jgi:tetratricopeptide (TPR) repeat protein
MKDFVFKIFGAPYTFDLYLGNESEIRYFQNFDGSGKENSKLTIHRLKNGKVSYSYLRYNFISSSGRSNSFFGMSVVFDNEYCEDIEKIFDLFDVIYKDIILNNSILIAELKDNPTAQAKYLVRTFAEAESEVKKIENNIINNLKSYFSNDIRSLDSSFSESNSMVKLNRELSNAEFIDALHKCSWVHISSEYSKNEDIIPDHEFLEDINNVIIEIQDQGLSLLVISVEGGNVHNQIRTYIDKANRSMDNIHIWVKDRYNLQKGVNPSIYLKKQPELERYYNKLSDLRQKLNKMLNASVKNKTKLELEPPTSVNEEKNKESGEVKKVVDNGSFFQKNRAKILTFIMALTALIVICIAIDVLTPVDRISDPITPLVDIPIKEINQDSLMNKGKGALAKRDFEIAIALFEQLGNTQMVTIAKDQAITYWNKQAENAVNEKAYQKAIEYLQETIKYGNDPSIYIEQYKQEINKSNPIVRKRNNDKLEKPNNTKLAPKATEVDNVPDQSICVEGIIKVYPKRGSYSVNEKFEASVVSKNGIICTDGEWRYEEGLSANKHDNPTKVEIVSVPKSGVSFLRYYVGNKQVAGIQVQITP